MKLHAKSCLVLAIASAFAGFSTAQPASSSAPTPTAITTNANPAASPQKQHAQASPEAASSTTNQPAALRDAIVNKELLLSIASKVNETDARSRNNDALLAQEMRRGTWISLFGVLLAVIFAGLTGFVGFQYSRYLIAKREQAQIDAGKAPLSVLVHRTRDEITRLAQRLQMAGHTDTRLFKSLMDALPALQVEAGKATINLNKQIPKSAHASLEGPAAPLDPLRSSPPIHLPPATQKAAPAALPEIAAADISVAALTPPAKSNN